MLTPMVPANDQTCKKTWWGWERLAKPLPSCLLSGWTPRDILARFTPQKVMPHDEAQFHTGFSQKPLTAFLI